MRRKQDKGFAGILPDRGSRASARRGGIGRDREYPDPPCRTL